MRLEHNDYAGRGTTALATTGTALGGTALLGTLLNGGLGGILGGNPTNTPVNRYEMEQQNKIMALSERTWNDRQYLWPLPTTDMQLNENLRPNNPGY